MRILLVTVCFLAYAALAFGFGKGVEGCSGDCTACHKVTKSEVQEIFKKIDPAVTVEDVSPAPARSLYQLTLKKGGAVQIMYLDFSKNYLVAGQLIEVGSMRDVTRQSVEAATTIDVAGIPRGNALVMGNPKGKKEFYVFSDPECPYCAKLHQTLTEMVKEDPALKIYIILNPLEIHPDSLWKTDAIICKSREDRTAALRMLENSYQGKAVTRLSCKKSYGEENRKIAAKLGATVTPVIVFPDGKVIMGSRSKEEIRKMLESGPKAK